jgi:hypothetical protein
MERGQPASMAIYPGNPTLSIAVNSYLAGVFPGATSCQKAFPREPISVVWSALAHIVQTGKFIAFIVSAIGQLKRIMAVSSTAVVRRYNKGKQQRPNLGLDGQLPAVRAPSTGGVSWTLSTEGQWANIARAR